MTPSKHSTTLKYANGLTNRKLT